MKLKDTAKITLLNWVNAKDVGLGKVERMRDLRSGEHFYAIAQNSGLIESHSKTDQSKFDSILSFLDGYYGNNVIKSIDIEKARHGDDLELGKIGMLLLNAALTTDVSYISICDKLPSPAPRQILEIVQTLITVDSRKLQSLQCATTTMVTSDRLTLHETGCGDSIDRDQSGVDECFKILYENVENTFEPSLQDLSKRLKFDETYHSVDITLGDGDHSRACGDESHVQEPQKNFQSKTSPSSGSLMDDNSVGTPVANFLTSNRKVNRSANVETPTTSRSPLSKLSQSPLVQFKRQIREKDLEIKRLKEFLAEKNYEIDSLKVESSDFGKKIQDLTVEIHKSKKSNQEYKKLKRDNEQAIIEIEQLRNHLREKNSEIEKLRADQESLNDCDLEIKCLKQLNSVLENTNEVLTSKLETKERNINALNCEIHRLKSQIDNKDEHSRRECDYLREQQTHLQSELKLYRDRLDEMNFSVESDKKYERMAEQLKMDVVQKDSLINELSCTLTKEREQFADSVSSLTNEVKSLNAKSDDLLDKVKSLESSVSEKSDMADRTYKDLQISRSENLELKQNIETMKIQAIEHRHQLDVLKENNHRLNTEISKKDSELTSKEHQLNEQRDALNTLDCQIAELKLRHKRIVEENSALNMQLDDLKVQSEFERNKVALLDENEKKISSDRLKEIDEVANQLQTENTALKVRILDRERQIDQLKMKHAEEIINLQRKTLEKQSHHSCNALNRSHVLDVSAAEHSKSALNAFVTPRMQSRYGSFQVDANSRTRPEDLYSLRSADSGETFRSVRSADHFFDHNLGCENEPDIMVEHSLTPNNVKNPSKDQTPKVNIVEKQVAISMHLDPLASAFKRPLTPTLKITLEHGISTESIQHQAVTPENSGILTPTENWSRRLTILNRRNNMVLPHLKSFYPTETQILSTEVKENDVRFSNDYKAPEVTVEKTKRKVDDTASKYSSSSPSPTSSSATSKTLKHSAKKSSKFMSVGSKFKRFWREPNTAQNQMPLTPDPTLKDYQMKKSSIAFSIVNSGHKTRKSKKNAAVKQT